MASSIDILFANADMRCSVCKAKAGTCGCWVKCGKDGCKWSRLKDGECGNPEHAPPLERFYWRFHKDGVDKMDDAKWAAWLETLSEEEFDAAVAAHGKK